jgi:osmotically inducible protein OsmC
MLFKRQASAIWNGSAKNGKGFLSTESNFITDAPYSFNSRFEQENGTNPEELIAAAHAGCYSMALSFMLAADGIKSEDIATQATVTIESVDDEIKITSVHLMVTGTVPGMIETDFQRYAEKAKNGCAVSRVLNASISMECNLRV